MLYAHHVFVSLCSDWVQAPSCQWGTHRNMNFTQIYISTLQQGISHPFLCRCQQKIEEWKRTSLNTLKLRYRIRGPYWQWRARTLWGSRGLHWQWRANILWGSTLAVKGQHPVRVLGSTLAMKGQHTVEGYTGSDGPTPCGGLGGCVGSQGLASLGLGQQQQQKTPHLTTIVNSDKCWSLFKGHCGTS